MPSALIAGLIIVFLLNLAADRVRDRVDVVRVGDRLTVRNQQAALRIDAVILAVCMMAVLYALAARSSILILIAVAAVAAVGWRIVRARRAPVFTFDRGGNTVTRDQQPVCALSAISGLVHVAGERTSSLVLNYRDTAGQPHQTLIHRAAPRQVEALHAVVADFLARG